MVDVRMQDMSVRTRIAPSPTGQDLHIGNAYTALINYIFAKQQKGKFLIRIEDTDQVRYVRGAEDKILESINWLGLTPDESPKINGLFGPYRQSERLSLYQKYAEELVKKGKAYYCFCLPERLAIVRKQRQEEGKPPMYDEFCKKETLEKVEARIKKGEKYVIRLDVPDCGETSFIDLVRGKITFQNQLIDDQIILKSDGYPTYHLAVVVDDHLMEISHVIRAEEWLSSTPKHILLYSAFGWKLPIFAHTPILRNPDKSKLSKRKNPVWLSWYKEEGFLPEAIVNYLLTLGWSHPEDKTIFPLTEAIKRFTFSRIVKSGPIFDLTKLTWLNGEYIRMMQNDDLGERLYSFSSKKYDRKLLLRVSGLLKDRIKKLSDANNLLEFFIKEVTVDPKQLIPKKRITKEVKEVLNHTISSFSTINNWNSQALHQEGNNLVNSLGWKPVELFQLIRIAISGKTVTLPLFESLEILGKETTLKRLKNALVKLS